MAIAESLQSDRVATCAPWFAGLRGLKNFVLASSAMIEMTTHNQNPTIVRAASGADAVRLSALAHQLLLHERALNDEMGELTRWAATPEELRKQMLRPNTQFFVAEKEHELIGYLKVVIHGRPLTREEIGAARWLIDVIERTARGVFDLVFRRPRPNVEASGGYISGVFVQPADRRAGVGRRLIAAAEDWLRGQGVETSDLHVLHANQEAWRFWEDAGYKPLTLGMRKKL
jgi:ribosomal protein S18 acetylase RimI-like enzyme